MNKKADGNSVWIIVVLVLALVFAVGIAVSFAKVSNKSNQVQDKFTACEGVNGYCASECKTEETKIGENVLGCPPKTNDKATLCCIKQGTAAKDLISLGYIEENGESWNYVNNGDTITLSKTKQYSFSLKVMDSAEIKYCTLGLYDSKETEPPIQKVFTDIQKNIGCNNRIYLPDSTMVQKIPTNTKFVEVKTYTDNKEDIQHLVKSLKVTVVFLK